MPKPFTRWTCHSGHNSIKKKIVSVLAWKRFILQHYYWFGHAPFWPVRVPKISFIFSFVSEWWHHNGALTGLGHPKDFRCAIYILVKFPTKLELTTFSLAPFKKNTQQQQQKIHGFFKIFQNAWNMQRNLFWDVLLVLRINGLFHPYINRLYKFRIDRFFINQLTI